jgi:hypothetical protein
LLDGCLAPSLRARGFAESGFIATWPDVVGASLSLYSRPLKIDWKGRKRKTTPGGGTEPATLVVLVESAFALELQHMEATIIERINTLYGWRCVDRLVLKHGTVARPEPPKRKERPLTDEERSSIRAAVEGIPNEKLRQALEHLGEAVLSSRKTR